MGLPKQFAQLSKIIFGQTASSNLKMTDMMAVQHVDISGSTGVNTLNQISVAQALCEPVAISTTNNPSNGAYVATCENYPDFSITYKDNNDTDHYLYGLKVRVRFDHGITYGAVGGNTPTLNINGSGALQILAQGKPVGKGAATDGQFLELTLVPYGNSVAWDADSNVLESTSDYTIYTDGVKTYTADKVYNDYGRIIRFYVNSTLFYDFRTALLNNINSCPVGTSLVEIVREDQTYQRMVLLTNKTNNNYFSFIGTSFYNKGSFSYRYNNGTWLED